MSITQSLVNIGGTGLPIEFPEHYLNKKDGDKYYLNEEGDEMTGTLDMNSNTITEVGAPKVAGDAANKHYVDHSVEKIRKMVKTDVVDKVLNLQRKAGDNSKHIDEKYKAATKEITALKHFLLKKIPTYYRIEAVIANTKNINNLVYTFEEGVSILKNFILLQILIETKPGAWFDMHLLSPSYTFRIYQKGNRLFIVSTNQLPKDWTRKINFAYTKW